MQKSKFVLYVDAMGKSHDALVFAARQRVVITDRFNQKHVMYNTTDQGGDDCVASVVYVDSDAPEAENLKKAFDIPHMSDPSKQETNPELPTYHVNCWKEVDEEHRALPSDHPAFDHPSAPAPKDAQGNVLAVARPEYEADLAAHQEAMAEETDVATLLDQERSADSSAE